jgi:hypothetical protein
MPRHRVEALVHLLRQGLAIEGQFGLHPIEAMVWVALTVEESVYRPESFVQTPSGVAFTLANPPLRAGAFSALRVGVDGRAPVPEGVRVRSPPGGAWREASGLSRSEPLELRPGEPIDFEVETALEGRGRPRTVRLELQSVAIPPLVWLEFTDTPRSLSGAP